MSIFFQVLTPLESGGLICDICGKGDQKTQMQNMTIGFADGERSQGEITASVHYSCLVDAGNKARARHIRLKRNQA